MSDSAKVIRSALRDDGYYRGRDHTGKEWRFVVDDEGEVWGYLYARIFEGDLGEAATAIAAFLADAERREPAP